MFNSIRSKRAGVSSFWRGLALAVLASLLAAGVVIAAGGDIDFVITTDAGGEDAAQTVLVQPDDKIVLAGQTCTSPDMDGMSECDIVLARYDPDLQLDTTFGGDGIQVVNLGSSATVTDLALQVDGRYVVAGQLGDSYFIARFDASGEQDPTFNETGIYTSAGFVNSKIAIQSDGKILFSVASGRRMASSTIHRLNPDGSIDYSFGAHGAAKLRPGQYLTSITDLAIQPDGRIIAAGGVQKMGALPIMDFYVARLTSDGKMDSSFGDHGVHILDLGGDENVDTISLQNDGKIVLAGSTFNFISMNFDFGLVRLDADGILDPSFNGSGVIITDLVGGGDDLVLDSAYQPDGKTVVVGYTNSYGPHDFAFARYNPDGSLDLDFGVEGKVIFGLGHFNQANGISLQSDGNYIVAGFYAYYGYPYEIRDIVLMRVLR